MSATSADQRPPAKALTRDQRLALLGPLLRERILVIDGAMGTMIQQHQLAEAEFRGERFRDHPRDLRGDNDLLVLTRPDDGRATSTAATSKPARTSSRRTRFNANASRPWPTTGSRRGSPR